MKDRLRSASDAARRSVYRALERFRVGDQLFHILMASVIGALSGLGGVAFSCSSSSSRGSSSAKSTRGWGAPRTSCSFSRCSGGS